MSITRVQASDHESEAVSAEGLPKQACELRVAIWNVALFALLALRQSRYDLPQRQQALVDINRFFCGNVAGLRSALTTRQINELQGANDCVVRLLSIDLLKGDLEHAMTTRAGVVHVVARHDLVLDTKVVKGKNVLGTPAFKSVEVLDLEMVLVPLQFETRSICHQSLQMTLVQQVIHSFFVDLQVGAIDSVLFASRSTLLFDHLEEKTD